MPKRISRSDRLGLTVLLVLAALLAVFLVTNRDSGTSEVATFADLAPGQADAVAPAQAVATTAPVEMPVATPTSAPVAAAAVPLVDTPADETQDDVDESSDTADDDGADDDAAADQGTADDSSTDESSTATASASADENTAAAAEPTSTGSAAANPQPAATEVPNPQPATTAVPNPQPATTAVPNPQPATTAVPNPQPSTQTAAAPVSAPADAPSGGTFTRTLTATVSQPSLHTSAGGSTFMPSFNGTSLPPVNPTVFGNPLVYRVLAGEPGDAWAKVYVPARPNGTTAWVQTSQFNWGSSNRMLQINVSTNTVTVFEGSNVLITTAAVTGKSSSPTPLANGWVEEIMAGPSAAYGPRLISLGIFSDALNSFGGSVPKVALHGTNNPGLMGQYASNGCIRVPNDIITQIAGLLPVGSKVVITR